MEIFLDDSKRLPRPTTAKSGHNPIPNFSHYVCVNNMRMELYAYLSPTHTAPICMRTELYAHLQCYICHLYLSCIIKEYR